MMTFDTNFYTIKQIDDYLATTKLNGFALEAERNRLIHRLKVRLCVANNPDLGIYPVPDIVVAVMENGFGEYSKVLSLLSKKSRHKKTPVYPLVYPPFDLKTKFVDMVVRIHAKGIALNHPKFVFCDESIEILFYPLPWLKISIESFYNSPLDTYIAAIIQPSEDAIKKKKIETLYYVHKVDAYDVNALLEFIHAVMHVRDN